jgi:hypothetical protein
MCSRGQAHVSGRGEKEEKRSKKKKSRETKLSEDFGYF